MKKKHRGINKMKILGTNPGTANTRLVRTILFTTLQKTNLNICFICDEKIELYVELTIEHKIPWERNKSKELFWDQENIAFSHAKCNRAYRKFRRIMPGQNWCIGCRKAKSANQFTKDKSRSTGLLDRCKPCQSVFAKAYYQKNIDHERKLRKESYQRNKANKKAYYIKNFAKIREQKRQRYLLRKEALYVNG